MGICLLGTAGGQGSDWSLRVSIVRVDDREVMAEEERCGGRGRGRAMVAIKEEWRCHSGRGEFRWSSWRCLPLGAERRERKRQEQRKRNGKKKTRIETEREKVCVCVSSELNQYRSSQDSCTLAAAVTVPVASPRKLGRR